MSMLLLGGATVSCAYPLLGDVSAISGAIAMTVTGDTRQTASYTTQTTGTGYVAYALPSGGARLPFTSGVRQFGWAGIAMPLPAIGEDADVSMYLAIVNGAGMPVLYARLSPVFSGGSMKCQLEIWPIDDEVGTTVVTSTVPDSLWFVHDCAAGTFRAFADYGSGPSEVTLTDDTLAAGTYGLWTYVEQQAAMPAGYEDQTLSATLVTDAAGMPRLIDGAVDACGNAVGASFDILSQGVAIFGDSRTQLGLAYFYGATFADTKGLDIAQSSCGQGITATGSGTLEFRASDGYLRWTAPSDTAGPWTLGRAGVLTLESGTADKQLTLNVRSYSANPVTDQTITVTVSGTYRKAWLAEGYWVWAVHGTRWPMDAIYPLGVSGSTTEDVIEQLAQLQSVASGQGYDIILCGTNDISADTPAATTIANLTTIYDARRALGRRLVLVNENARWGTAINTPMTAQQQSDHAAINAFIAQYAATYGCIHVDAYAATYDSGQTDRRPISGYLKDAVHFSDTGAFVVGKLIADAICSEIGVPTPRSSTDPENLLSIGAFAGTGGTAGTGTSGTVATGWTVSRASGDATVTASVESRGDAGQWQVMAWTATTASVVQAATASLSLASLGLSAGDTIYGEVECICDDFANVYNTRFLITFTGASPALDALSSTTADGTVTVGDGRFVLRVPTVKIPSGTTGLLLRAQARCKASSSGTMKVGSAAIVKVT